MAIIKYPAGSLGAVQEGEERLLKYLEVNLPDCHYIIPYLSLTYTNPRNNQVQILEYDILVVSPHGIFNIENKDWGGRLEGDDRYWYVNGKERRNPHITTKWKTGVLASKLKAQNRSWGKAWIQTMVTLSNIYQTKQNIWGDTQQLTFLLEDDLTNFIDDSNYINKDHDEIEDIQLAIVDFLVGAHAGVAKSEKTKVLEFNILETLEQKENYTEYLGKPSGVSSSIRFRIKEYALSLMNLPLEERKKQKNIIQNQYKALNKIKSNPFILNVAFRMDDESHTFYEISEFLDENTLQSELQRKTFTQEEKWKIIDEVISATFAAHQANVFHRDINPVNIFLTNGYAALGNFGKSYFFDHHHEGYSVMLSVSENNIGPYQAQELLAGDAGRYTDVYSIGILIYKLFTDKLPIEDPIQLRKIGGKLPKEKLPTSLNPQLPEWLDELCMHTIRSNSDDRWDNLATLRGFIQNNLQEDQTSSQPVEQPFPARDLEAFELQELKPGSSILEYTLIDELGSGGFSRVFSVQRRLSSGLYAMKVYNESVDAQSVKNEYDALSELNHENIVRFEWNGLLPNGHFFTLMEYIEGENMKNYSHGDLRLPLRKVYQLAESILSALVAMQDRPEPIYHRDIKPNNIIWEKGERFVLIDFNVASAASLNDNNWVGTNPYIAPDLAETTTLVNWDTSADTFALGITLYELVCKYYPWKHRMPLSDTAPINPKEFNDKISDEFSEFLLRAIQPFKTHRFFSAQQMLDALREIGVNGLFKAEEKTTPVVVKEYDEHIVDYINSLFSQSKYGNIGTRARQEIHPFDEATYTETFLDKKLIPAILDGSFKLVIITGNAGDGKTALIKNIEHKAKQAKTLGHNNGATFIIQGIPFISNYDGSQDQADRANDEVLDEFFKPFDGVSSFHNTKEGRIIAINEGRLVDFLQASSQYKSLADVISNYFAKRGEEPLPEGVLIINLNLRSVTTSKENQDKDERQDSILRQQVRKLVQPELWTACEGCSEANHCFIKYNVESLRDSAAGEEVISRLEMMVHAASLKRAFHITMRDLRSFLAYLITRDHSCKDIAQAYVETESNPYEYYKNFYFNISDLSADDRGNEDRLIELVRSLDVAQVPLPGYDRDLYFEPHSPNNYISFESRSFDLIDLFNSQKELLPAYQQQVDVVSKIKDWHNLFSRHQYFEGVITYQKRLPYHSINDFNELLKNPQHNEAIQATLKGLAKAIALNEGCDQEAFYEDKLILSSSHVRDPFSHSFRLFPLSDFELKVNNAEALADYLEYQPDNLILQHKRESHIKLNITLDLFEMLQYIQKGFTPSVNDIKGQFVELEIFKNLLENLDYSEVIITRDNREFYSITKKENLSLHLEKLEI